MSHRWMCPCGRFVAESSIDERSRMWGGDVITEATYHCSRCGTRDDLPWLVETKPEPTDAGPPAGRDQL